MTDGAFEGRVAVVTGASSGIGRATALHLGRRGADVIVNYHGDRAAAEAVAGEIAAAGGRAEAVQADVGDEDAVKAMFARACERFGTVHLLVNNAGIQKDADLLEMSLDDWSAVIRTNLTGAFLCAREAARIFCTRAAERPARGGIGTIVFVSSVHERIPWAGHANYASAKAGGGMLMRTCAQEFGPSGIRVNAVAPGAVKTAINEAVWTRESGRDALLGRIPYGRIGEPEDVAEAIAWLASPASDYVHGETLVIDGGMMLYPSFREGG